MAQKEAADAELRAKDLEIASLRQELAAARGLEAAHISEEEDETVQLSQPSFERTNTFGESDDVQLLQHPQGGICGIRPSGWI